MRVLVGFDGSPAASAAIDAGGKLFPDSRAWIVHLWTAPFASTSLRQRLWSGSSHINEFVEAVEREGEREADRTAAMGVILARAAGWQAEPLVTRSFGGEGLRIAELAEKLEPDVVLLGSRGLGGTQAVLGSVSDMVVHYTPKPALVVPHPLLSAEYEALESGPVVVGYDGSPGAQIAVESAARLFPTRELLPVTVDDDEGSTPAAPTAGLTVTHLRTHRRYGPSGRTVAGALAAHARDTGAAAVVVGSRGRSAVREILLGSVAKATLHHAYRPVLVVPVRAAE